MDYGHLRQALLPAICLIACLLAAAIADDNPDAPTTQPAELPFTISPETTYLTEPLAEDGTVDYIAALNAISSEGVTPDNNAAVLVIQAMGYEARLSDPEDTIRNAVLEQIGATAPDEGEGFPSLDEFLDETTDTGPVDWERGSEEEAIARRGPCRSEDVPLVARWLEGNAASLDILVEASQRPRWYLPLVANPHAAESYKRLYESYDDPRIRANGMIEVLPPTSSALGYALAGRVSQGAKALICRANLAAGEGRVDHALEDLLAVRRLGALFGQGPYLIDQLIAIAFHHMGNEAATSLLSAVPVSEHVAREMLPRWRALPATPSLAASMREGERCFFLDTASWGATRPEDLRRWLAWHVLTSAMWDHRAEQPAQIPSWADPEHAEVVVQLFRQADWNEVLRAANADFERKADAWALPLQARIEAFSALESERQERWLKANNLAVPADPPAPETRQDATEWTINALLSMPSYLLAPAAQFAERAETEHELVAIALALAIYHADNDGYPDSLDDLAPDYLDEIGDDVFSGQPYVYVTTDGGYLLYSVGMNLTDDGGLTGDEGPAADDEDAPSDADDLVIRVGE